MSKSWKKTYSWSDCVSAKWGQRQTNKACRRNKDVPDGKAYQKLFERWDFRDYRFPITEFDLMNRIEDDKHYCRLRVECLGEDHPWAKRYLKDLENGCLRGHDDEIRNYACKKNFPRYGRRDRKRARNMKRGG